MNDSVMGLVIELYRNPELLEFMKLYNKLNEQNRQKVLAYLKNTVESYK